MSLVKLTDICNPKQWKTIPTDKLLSEGFPVYGANGIIGYFSEYNHENPVIAITCRGATCGSINITKPNSYITGNAMCLDDVREDINIKYLYYALKNYNFNNVISGSAQPQITRQGLSKVVINIDVDNQDKVIGTLSNIENIINSLEQKIKLLDELVKARFVEMFGKEKPFKPLSELSLKITDGSHNPPKGIDISDYMMLSSQNIWEELDLTDVRYLSKEDFELENKRTDIKDGDVLLTIVGTIGRTHVVKNNEKYTFQRSVAIIKPINKILDGVFLSSYLKTDDAVLQLEKGGHGSSQKGIYLQDIKKLMIPDVDYNRQIQFREFVEQIDKSKFVCQKKIEYYQELLDKKMNEYFE